MSIASAGTNCRQCRKYWQGLTRNRAESQGRGAVDLPTCRWHLACEGGLQETAMPINATLLDLITVLTREAESEAEVIATVVAMVNRGTVRLCVSFKGARFDRA